MLLVSTGSIECPPSWMQSMCWSCLLCSPYWSWPSCSSWGSYSIWARLFDGVTTKLEMCPQGLVNQDGNVSGTKDRDGIDQRDLLKVEHCPIGVSSSTLQLWSHSCTGWNKEFQWQSISPLPHVIVSKVVEPRSLWALFKLIPTLVLEHTLCCYQTRYCKLEEAQASC